MDQQIDNRWLKRLVAVVAIAVLGLAACTADGGKESSGQGSDSGASSDAGGASDGGGIDGASDGGASDEPDEFAMPPENEALTQPDPANYPGMDSASYSGAEVTVRYFVDAMYYGFATGDTGPMESVTSQYCPECHRFKNAILARTNVYGEYDVGASIQPQEMHEDVSRGEGLRAVYYAFYEDEHSTRLSNGTMEVNSGRNMISIVDLEYWRGRWQVVDFTWGENPDA